MTDDDIIADAISQYPDCKDGHVTVENGLAFPFRFTRVANLWRSYDCYKAGEPPLHIIEGYPGYGDV